MQITVIGTGYVGLVTAACLAANDNEVICIDNDERKITALQSGQVPFTNPARKPVKKVYPKRQYNFF